MGNTTSKANIVQENNQLFINQDDVKSFSEQINSQISNTLIANAKSCSADINNNQAIMIKGFTTKGDFDFTAGQKQAAALTFSCVQANNVRNTAGSQIVAQMTNALSNDVSTEALSKLDQNAKNSASSSYGAIGNVQTNTNVKALSNYKSVTQNHKDIENVVKNAVQNNFSSKNVSNCISQTNNSQQLSLQEVNVGGKAVIAINQDQAASVVSECIQEDNIGNTILNNALSSLGVQITDKSFAKSTMTSESKVVSEAHQAGLFESIGNMISGIFGNAGVLISCAMCCCVVLVVVYLASNFISENPQVLMGMPPI